ncbi:hypothetical protein UlMin_013531 [Ulmus minor]
MSDSSNKISVSEEMNIKSPNGASLEETQKKTCADCGTTKTPLWRGGPTRPNSLCNACGIKRRKKRRVNLGLNKTSEDRKAKKSTTNNKNGGNETKIGDRLKQRLLKKKKKVEERE